MPGESTANDRRHWRYRANVSARTIAATVGSYLLAAAFSVMLARAVPLDRAQAAMLATLAGIVLAPAVSLWCFLANSAWRVCGGVAAAIVVFAMLAWLIGAPA